MKAMSSKTISGEQFTEGVICYLCSKNNNDRLTLPINTSFVAEFGDIVRETMEKAGIEVDYKDFAKLPDGTTNFIIPYTNVVYREGTGPAVTTDNTKTIVMRKDQNKETPVTHYGAEIAACAERIEDCIAKYTPQEESRGAYVKAPRTR